MQLFLKALASTITFSHIVSLVDLIDKVDRIIVGKPKTVNRMLWPALSLFVFGLYLFISYYFTHFGTLFSYLTRPLTALIWHKEPQQCLLYAFFAHQLNKRFLLVREMVEKPERGRLAHAYLATCVRTFTKAFGLRMLINIVSVGIDYLFNVYMNTYHHVGASLVVLIVGALDCFFTIYLPPRIATELIEQAHAVEDDLLAMALTDKNEAFCRQVELFLEEVRTSNLEITAWGVFRLDTGLYGSFVNTLLTFFIAMAGLSNEITSIINRYGLN